MNYCGGINWDCVNLNDANMHWNVAGLLESMLNFFIRKHNLVLVVYQVLKKFVIAFMRMLLYTIVWSILPALDLLPLNWSRLRRDRSRGRKSNAEKMSKISKIKVRIFAQSSLSKPFAAVVIAVVWSVMDVNAGVKLQDLTLFFVLTEAVFWLLGKRPVISIKNYLSYWKIIVKMQKFLSVYT